MKRIVAMLLLAVFLTGCKGAAAAPNGDFEFYYRSAKDEIICKARPTSSFAASFQQNGRSKAPISTRTRRS